MLSEGDLFPSFSLTDQDGRTVTNEDLKGQKAVIYFYPKDDTSGCTAQACSFRDEMPRYEGIHVVGVSPDPQKSHKKFEAKYGLNFTLLSDTEHKLSEACGVWVEKSMYGRKYMGVERSTFVLDEDGRVTKALRKVKAEGHALDLLEQLA